ncbi:Putative ribonuclease H protein [Dendrobium catenatum]|uniref:Ribonuclease H protein n=1 Tax=Dendrobium catenatum TaxID=906689 RepID=A0A2I0VB18_9ASPA|nr:Putative ribonuclease H protein [Dendrobium catenatum]
MLPKCYAMPILEQWCTSQPSRLSSSFYWCTSPPGWVKFNVDDSVRPNAVAGLGVIARDHAGRLVVAVGTQVEQWDVTKAEILAGLAFLGAIEEWMHNLDRIIIESDCRIAIQWLQAAFNRLNKLHVQTDGPDLSFLLEFKQVIFQHAPRELNRPADFCANMACFGNFIWRDCDSRDIPPSLMSLLEADSTRA